MSTAIPRDSARRQIVAALARQFPRAGSKTLARMLMQQHPAWFKHQEAARSAVRHIRGRNGCASRKRVTVEPLPRVQIALPQPKREIAEWEIVRYEGALRVGLLSDLHVPFHEPETIELLCDEFERKKINMLFLNGDIADFYSISKFQPRPDLRNFQEERDMVVQTLEYFKKRFPKARRIFKIGNHEERYESYMINKAPELFNVPEFQVEALLKLEALGYECVRDRRPVMFGPLFCIHGHEYRFAISNPVNAARGLFLRGKSLAVCGHFHQHSNHTERTLSGKLLSTWSTGCCCFLNPQYMPLNNWSNGGAYIETTADNEFELQNFKVVKGKLYG
jgi:predicted phosphodiesterase